MDQKKLLEFLHKSEVKMDWDYENEREGHYPPLYSRDYLFGKLKAVREIIQLIEG